MNYIVLTLLILLSVFIAVSKAVTSSTGARQSSTATPTTTPQPLTFDCDNGFVSNIGGINITKDALLVKNGTSESLCHMTEKFCVWQNKTMLHVTYDPEEKDKSSKFVAGKLFRYELQCKSGYLSKVNATAYEIHSSKANTYFHQEKTVSPPVPGAVQLKLFKKGDSHVLSVSEKVSVGDKLVLKMSGPALHSLKPINCTAYNGNSKSKKYTLWNNTECSSYDKAIMSNEWRKDGDTTIAIEMSAFRFVDSYTVNIECSAYVCPHNDLNCGVSIKNCMTTVAPGTTTVTLKTTSVNQIQTKAPTSSPGNSLPTVRRRRRSVIKKYYEEDIASTSFTVVDSLGDSNGSAGLFLNTSLQFTMLLVFMFAIGKGESN